MCNYSSRRTSFDIIHGSTGKGGAGKALRLAGRLGLQILFERVAGSFACKVGVCPCSTLPSRTGTSEARPSTLLFPLSTPFWLAPLHSLNPTHSLPSRHILPSISLPRRLCGRHQSSVLRVSLKSRSCWLVDFVLAAALRTRLSGSIVSYLVLSRAGEGILITPLSIAHASLSRHLPQLDDHLVAV